MAACDMLWVGAWGVSMWSGEGADCGTILSWRKYFEKICHTSVANVSFDEIL